MTDECKTTECSSKQNTECETEKEECKTVTSHKCDC